MHIFDINVWPLLNTHSGDRLQFHFEDVVPEGTWEDLQADGKLTFDIEMIAIDGGVDLIIKDLTGLFVYEALPYEVEISDAERTFMKEWNESLPDDINPINLKHATVDLGKVLREEILMQIL